MRILVFALFAAALAGSAQAAPQPRAGIIETTPGCVCKPASAYRARYIQKRAIARRLAVSHGLRTRIVKVVPSIGYDPLPYRFDAVPARRYVVTRYYY